MNWLETLLFGNSVAHSVFVIAATITIGLILGKIKIAGVGFGVMWILFAGIILGHFGMGDAQPNVYSFLEDFGLILFVYAIGLQIGPSFFASFKTAGIKMNLTATLMVALTVLITVAIYKLANIPIPTLAGIMTGAVTNTPAMSAATQAASNIDPNTAGEISKQVSLGYALAYPLGVVGAIASIYLLKVLFRISDRKETILIDARRNKSSKSAIRMTLEVLNPTLNGQKLADLHKLTECHFVISRICTSGGVCRIASPDLTVSRGDKLLVVCDHEDASMLRALIGKEVQMQWSALKNSFELRRILVTNSASNGKSLAELKLTDRLSFNITRITRAGLAFVAHRSFELQIGDMVTAVGNPDALDNLEKALGNSMTDLRHPHLLAIFLGIFFGVILGSIPFFIPGIPHPVRLGLACGPMIAAIIIGRYGANFGLVTYTTISAGLMLRQIGMSLFLACVGLSIGEYFLPAILSKVGMEYIACGAVITALPIIIAGIFARTVFKMDFFTLTGVLSGGNTNPPALASCSSQENDLSAVGYATVYPLSMLLRIISAQLMIIIFM